MFQGKREEEKVSGLDPILGLFVLFCAQLSHPGKRSSRDGGYERLLRTITFSLEALSTEDDRDLRFWPQYRTHSLLVLSQKMMR